MTERHSPWSLPGFASPDAVREFAAVAAAFVLVFAVLSPAKQWSYFPVRPDDLSNLTASTWGDALRLSRPPVRPVSHLLIGMSSAAGVWRLKPTALTAVALAALAAAPLFPSYKPRNAMADWYAKRGAVNRNIVTFLVAQREALRPYPRLAVEGAPPQGPWFGTDGGFLAKRYGLPQQWLIVLPDTGEYYSRVVALLGPGGVEREGQIRHLLAGRDPVPPEVPRVRLNPDGTGTVELPPR